MDALELADIIAATVAETEAWARGPENVGPYSDDAFRAVVHINATLKLLEQRIRARANQGDQA